MKSKYNTKYIIGFSLLILWAVMLPTIATAQRDLTIYNLQSIPQTNYANPALIPDCKGYVGLGVSSIYLGLSNSGFTYKDLIKKGIDDSLYLDVDNMVKKLKNINYLNVQANYEILSFGFKVRKNYFNLSTNVKSSVYFGYPKDFFNFIAYGNTPYINKGEQDVGGFKINSNVYAEIALGISRQINDKLSVGIRPKFLVGIANINTKKTNVTMLSTDSTNNNFYDITLKSDLLINANVPENDYKFNFDNKGFAMDFGASYKLNKHFAFSASVVDLGSIRWKSNPKNYSSSGSNQYTFKGIDINNFFNKNDKGDKFEKLLDSIRTTFNIDSTRKSYTAPLVTKIYLSGTYFLSPKDRVGLLFRSDYFDKKLHPSYSLLYNRQFGKMLNMAASYSIINGSQMNIGLGGSLNLGAIQFYATTDNLYGVFAYKQAKNFNIHIGCNLTFGRAKFGRNIFDRDKDGVPDRKDECPDEPGLAQFNGCPDRDNDGVPDKLDLCPDEAGLPQFQGCPDRDGDGIIDKMDSCPDVAGLAQYSGCPDTDGDGIIDKLDSCPDVSGLAQYNGCPDTDGDGVIDKSDSCPDIAGLAQFNGCPDRDGDGVIDKLDSCPDQPGLPQFNGCPDRDGDGVIDKLDSCPDVPGIQANNGCPEIHDSDGDGVPDDIDKCPNLKGSPENSGCPVASESEQNLLNKAPVKISFVTRKSVLKESSYAYLNELVKMLNANTTMKLLIAGHTDNSGTSATNDLLSENMARSVKKYLVGKKIDTKRIAIIGYGQNKPVADNKTPEGRKLNRRVEISAFFE
jgi:outer membrane protein OmpA-like peptidoglycan-associated protein